jgi:hypothetical protein
LTILARKERKDDEQQLRMDVTENESDVIIDKWKCTDKMKGTSERRPAESV